MKNPFETGGLLDKGMPYIRVALLICLLVQGVWWYLNGSSILWALAAGVVLFSNCFNMYRQLRQRRLQRGPK
jgi:Flp pilus assembly protein TadB